jgi:hypothetical protein
MTDTSTVYTKRYELINQGYTAFVGDIPQLHKAQLEKVSDKDHTLFWHVALKKYFIFPHTMMVDGLRVRLTSVKKFAAVCGMK